MEINHNCSSSKKLSELIVEGETIMFRDPNVLKQKNEIPSGSLDNYNRYTSLQKEIYRRLKDYREGKTTEI